MVSSIGVWATNSINFWKFVVSWKMWLACVVYEAYKYGHANAHFMASWHIHFALLLRSFFCDSTGEYEERPVLTLLVQKNYRFHWLQSMNITKTSMKSRNRFDFSDKYGNFLLIRNFYWMWEVCCTICIREHKMLWLCERKKWLVSHIRRYYFHPQ